MWRTRAPPTPLDFEKIRDSAVAPPARQAQGKGTPRTRSSKQRQSQLNGEMKPASLPADSGTGLKDQRKLTLKDNLELFLSRFGPFLFDLYSQDLSHPDLNMQHKSFGGSLESR
jgi:ubiquitin-like 1-activating enzyme E1 B